MIKVLLPLPTIFLLIISLSSIDGDGLHENHQSPAFSDHPCDDCTWLSPSGAFYDLSILCDHHYDLRLDNPRGALLQFGVCSPVKCQNYDHAYGCLYVPQNQAASTGESYSYEQIEPNIAAAGIRLIIEGGEYCGKKQRKTIIILECQPDVSRHSSIPSPVRGWEGEGDELCVYFVLFRTPHACPTYRSGLIKTNPRITAVTGCVDSTPRLITKECHAAGGSELILHGVDFMSHPLQEVTSLIQVGSYPCGNPRVIDGWTMTCQLPAGTGEGHGVSITLKVLNEVRVKAGSTPMYVHDELYISSHSVTVSYKPLVDYKRHFDSFMDLGVGGLTKQITELYQRAFASRGIPASVLGQLGIDHAKGILLYGPPGSGKTLLARTVADILKTDKVTLVNAPEIMSKFLGESEKNLRSHFDAAEKDWLEFGEASDLHVIIIDEIDAICKRRGKSDSSAAAAAYDSVVNQLLTKMDGLKSLHNVLVIGMTNRKDMIDPALLRPGRFEVHIEIGLPDEEGRWEIFTIHTREMKKNNYLSSDVDLNELSRNTTQYSGAEIAGLVRLAASFALDRRYGQGHSDATLTVSRSDFVRALTQFKPSYTQREDDVLLEFLPRGYVQGGPVHDKIIEDVAQITHMMEKLERYTMETVLFYGQKGVGKSGLAAYLSKKLKFNFVKVLKATDLLRMDTNSRVELIVDIFHDAFKADFGLLILDDLDLIVECVKVHDVIKASDEMIHTLTTLMTSQPPPGHKLLIVGTIWSSGATLSSGHTGRLGVDKLFNYKFHVPNIDVQTMSHILLVEGFTSNAGMPLLVPDVSMSLRDWLMVLDCVDHWLSIARMKRNATPQNYFDHCFNMFYRT